MNTGPFDGSMGHPCTANSTARSNGGRHGIHDQPWAASSGLPPRDRGNAKMIVARSTIVYSRGALARSVRGHQQVTEGFGPERADVVTHPRDLVFPMRYSGPRTKRAPGVENISAPGVCVQFWENAGARYYKFWKRTGPSAGQGGQTRLTRSWSASCSPLRFSGDALAFNGVGDRKAGGARRRRCGGPG